MTVDMNINRGMNTRNAKNAASVNAKKNAAPKNTKNSGAKNSAQKMRQGRDNKKMMFTSRQCDSKNVNKGRSKANERHENAANGCRSSGNVSRFDDCKS